MGKRFTSQVALGALAWIALVLGIQTAQSSQGPKSCLFFVASTDVNARKSYARALAESGVAPGELTLVFSDRRETSMSIAYFIRDVKHSGPHIVDTSGSMASAHAVTHSTTLVRSESSRHEVLSGAVPSPLQLVTDDWKRTPTYSGRILALLNKCTPCHVQGGCAPFALDSYALAKKWAPMIHPTLVAGKMPPYRAVPGYRELHDDDGVTLADIDSVKRWHEAGAPIGKPARTNQPSKVVSSTGWRMGPPDVILKPRESYPIKADSGEEYRLFPLKTNLKEKRYLRLVDLKPGDSRVVHHVILYYDRMGESIKSDFQDGKAGYPNADSFGFLPAGAFGGWVPGINLHELPKGTAFELHPGACIVMQIHYSPIGVDTADQTELGLYFSKEKPTRIANYGFLEDRSLRISPGEKHYLSRATYENLEDVEVLGMLPHMHKLGQRMQIDYHANDKSKETLLAVDNWDFGWQLVYYFKKPLKVKAGSNFVVSAEYDNSAENPNNPSNPPKMVVSGNRTTNEMALVAYLYTYPYQSP